MVITTTVPQIWLRAMLPNFADLAANDAQLRHAVKGLLIKALNSGMAFAPAKDGLADPGGATVRVTISLPEPQSNMMRRVAEELGLGAASAVRHVLHALSTAAPEAPLLNDSPEMLQLIEALRRCYPETQLRHEQAQMYGYLAESLSRGAIGMIEASTGVGKTRVCLHVLAAWIDSHDANAVIATPTIALVRQFAAEYARQARVLDRPPLRVIFGQREFVSSTELERFLASPSGADWNSPEVRAWIAGGGPVAGTQDGIHARWLGTSLAGVAEGFPLDEVRLSELTPEADAGHQSYRAQFDFADSEPSIVLCTHAMLAQHMRRRLQVAGRDEDYRAVSEALSRALAALRGRPANETTADRDQVGHLFDLQAHIFATMEGAGVLPPFRALIVDEAHIFEESLSNSLSESLSLRAMLRHAHEYRAAGGTLKVAAIRDLETALGDIAAIGAQVKQDVVNLSSASPHAHALKAALARIAVILDAIPMPKRGGNGERDGAAIRLRRALAVTRLAAQQASARSYIRFSPVRSFPQIYIGRASVENVLNLLWSSIDAGAAVSATLYFGDTVAPTAFYQRALLAIPPDRVREFPPITASWLTTPVTHLYVPSRAVAHLLRPPSRMDRYATEHDRLQEELRWLARLAPDLSAIHNKSAGGVIVLLTSYANIDVLVGLLTKSDPDIALIAADGKQPVAAQRTRFLRFAHDGRKPLWLALGAAWTGLDVGGHDPWAEIYGASLPSGEDNVFTTLVIPRLPFGTNQSLTHLWRKNQRPGTAWELYEAAFRFKQGLGRLVRREGLPRNREIYVLDGRLSDPAFARTAPIFMRMMERYPVRPWPAGPGETA